MWQDCLQASAGLKARLQKTELELEIGQSKQQHLQLQCDSAAADSSALAQELEAELDNIAQLVHECKEEHSLRLQARSDPILQKSVMSLC